MREKLLLQKKKALEILKSVDLAVEKKQISDLDPLTEEARKIMFSNFEDGINEISFYDITEYIDFVRLNFDEIIKNNGEINGDLAWIKEYTVDIYDSLNDIK